MYINLFSFIIYIPFISNLNDIFTSYFAILESSQLNSRKTNILEKVGTRTMLDKSFATMLWLACLSLWLAFVGGLVVEVGKGCLLRNGRSKNRIMGQFTPVCLPQVPLLFVIFCQNTSYSPFISQPCTYTLDKHSFLNLSALFSSMDPGLGWGLV